MFIHFVTLAATLFFIFGLVRVTCLIDRLKSPIRSSLAMCNRMIRRPRVEASLQNENLEDDLIERPLILTNDWRERENVLIGRLPLDDKRKLSTPILEEPELRFRTLNPPRYSFENVSADELDQDLGLPTVKTHQLGITKDDTIRTSKQEGNENIFETLKNSIDKSNINPSSRLIYNLILKETMKENEAKQRLMNSAQNKINESLNETKDYSPTSSSNEAELKDDTNKSKN